MNVGRVDNSYDNVIRSFLTSFVFVTTGENYTEVLYQSIANSVLYSIYFVCFSVIGLFLFVPIIIWQFERGFSTYAQVLMCIFCFCFRIDFCFVF